MLIILFFNLFPHSTKLLARFGNSYFISEHIFSSSKLQFILAQIKYIYHKIHIYHLFLPYIPRAKQNYLLVQVTPTFLTLCFCSCGFYPLKCPHATCSPVENLPLLKTQCQHYILRVTAWTSLTTGVSPLL